MRDFSRQNRALIRGLLVGAVVITSASACSRSDRTEAGSNNTGAVTADTMGAGNETSTFTPGPGDTSSAATLDTTAAQAPANQPRAATAAPSAERGGNQDTSTAGYRSMERDTTGASMAAPSDTAPRDSARVTADSTLAPAEQSSVSPSDTAPLQAATPAAGDTLQPTPEVASDAAVTPSEPAAAADSAPMEVATPAAGDTAETAVDVAVAEGDSVVAAGDSVTVRDTISTPEQADTAVAAGEVDVAVEGQAAAGAETTDTVVNVGDSTHIGKTGERLDPVVASEEVNDTLMETEAAQVRPPEDSTEVYGNVIRDDADQEDRETVAAAEAPAEAAEPSDEVGAAAIGGNVNGADAVALMTRQGARCIVLDPQSDPAVAFDMSETPATLNPCGLGSMVLTRIWTQKE